jgi:hypothetical protein
MRTYKRIPMRFLGLATTRGWKMPVLVAAMLLGTCSIGLADNGCPIREMALRGNYVFVASGFTIVGGVAQPKAIVEVINFNGDGTLTVPSATVSINGTILKSTPGGAGNYTVDASCTGTISFTGGPSFDIVLSTKWDTIWMIQTNQNNVFQGIATKQ